MKFIVITVALLHVVACSQSEYRSPQQIYTGEVCVFRNGEKLVTESETWEVEVLRDFHRDELRESFLAQNRSSNEDAVTMERCLDTTYFLEFSGSSDDGTAASVRYEMLRIEEVCTNCTFRNVSNEVGTNTVDMTGGFPMPEGITATTYYHDGNFSVVMRYEHDGDEYRIETRPCE